MMATTTRAGIAGAALLMGLLLAGCGADSPDQLIASAKQYLAAKDHKAAIIQLKNALQQKPDLAEARFLLGQGFLDSGDPVSATVELGKALDLQHPPAIVVPVLARALLAQGQGKKVIEQYAGTTLGEASADADLKTSLAIAHAGQGDSARAQAELQAALQAQPDHPAALLFHARLKASQRDVDGAFALVDQVLGKAPDHHDALLLQGDLRLQAKADPAGAVESYKKAVAARANSVMGHSGIIAILLSEQKLDEAQAQFDQLKKVSPGHPQTTFFEAQLAFLRQDFDKAKALGEQLLKFAPDNVRALQLMGAVQLQKRALPQAEQHLTRAFQLAPDAVLTRRLLTQVYLASGQAAKAMTTIAPLAEAANAPADVLQLAAQAHLQAGELGKAETLFTRAVKLNPDDNRSRTALALTELSKGHTEEAFDQLEEIAAKDTGTTADMALIAAQIRRGDFDAALKAIDTLEKKQADKPLAATLRGRVHLARKDVAAARRSFEQALAIDATHFPAIAGLAAIDVAEQKPQAAQKRFDDLLKAKPKDLQATLALAQLKARSGGSKDEVSALITQAVQAHPGQAAPHLMLIEHLLRQREPKQALTAAQAAAAALPQDPRVLDALGRSQAAAGDFNQAIGAFNQLAVLSPQSPQAHLRLADVHLAQKNQAAALQSLRRALAITPNLLQAQRGVIALELAANRPKEAFIVAREVQKQRPDQAVGHAFEGDIEATRKNWDAAIAAYRGGLKKAGGAELAPKLHAALVAAGRRPEADKWAAEWTRDHPQDLRFLFHLGDMALTQRNFAAAEVQYQAVLRQQPENAAALNNLAWVSMEQGKPGALALAEKANSVRPNHPAFMDTLARALALNNQLPRALELQKQALALQPQNPSLRLHLAKLHLQAGDKAAARGELDALAQLGDKFRGQAEVEQLLKTF